MAHRGNVLDLVRLFLFQQEAISRKEALVREVVIFDSREGQRKLVVAKSLIYLQTYIDTNKTVEQQWNFIHTYILYIYKYINKVIRTY